MSNRRRSFSAEQKADVVRRHLSGKEPVYNLADELGVQPSQIHLWVKHVLDQAAKAFDRPGGERRRDDGKDRRITQLEAKLSQKNEVIAELMEENIRAKRQLLVTPSFKPLPQAGDAPFIRKGLRWASTSPSFARIILAYATG